MPKVSRLLTAGAVASAATLAFGGSAAWADENPVATKDGSTYTLKVRSHTTSEQFVPKGGQPQSGEPKEQPKEGDAFTFVDEVTQNGKKVGTDEGKCTVGKTTEKSTQAHCVVSVKLANGTLAVEGDPVFSEDSSASENFTLVGGTGAYAGAKGKVLVKDVNDADSDITITYTLDGSQVAEMPTGGAATGDGSTAGTENIWLYGVGAAAMAGGALVLAGSRRGARR